MPFSFSNHLALLDHFLARRSEIVDAIEGQTLNVRGKAIARHGDRESLGDAFQACFFESSALPANLSKLKGQLAASHVADGFEPLPQDGYSRDLDPVELILRAWHQWDQDRWPGRNGRLVYARSLFAVFMLRQLEYLSLRIWPEVPAENVGKEAAERLQQVQRLLDQLNSGGIASLVRDARWLIQTAQGPLTRHLKPYFVTADRISESFTGDDGIDIHKAGAVLAGGHLRSQLRHRSWETGWMFDDSRVLAMTRNSSAMDLALLVRDLVPLLQAYNAACAQKDSGDNDTRLALADSILQGLSADPELLLTRLDLLGPTTTIEDFLGDIEAHRKWLASYAELIGRAAKNLNTDAALFDPANATYSPFGITYGFCADILSNMVLHTLRSSSTTGLSVEDTFISRGKLEEKRAQAEAWKRLPKSQGERDPFDHSSEWAQQIFGRLVIALDARAAHPTDENASGLPQARLYVVPRGVKIDALPAGSLPAGIVSAQEHCLTSDFTQARDTGSTAFSKIRMATDRAEGRFLASAEVDGAWFGVSKVPLTFYLSKGTDAVITDIPPPLIEVLRLVCPELLVVI